MTYNETLEFLYNSLPAYQRIGKAAYKSDLVTTIDLDKHFGHPHRQYKTIHVAGTNGKGSVSSMLASVLIESGLRTGLYTSPHLRDFRERIRVDGEMISKEYVRGFVSNNKGIIEDLEPSFFEMTVALAFQYFADMRVDIAVIETGMGGRLDSTNIVSPLVSVITNIGLDHMQFLGKTHTEIAGEKAGIIKKDVPLVIGRTDFESSKVFKEKAIENNSEIFFADQELKISRQATGKPNENMLVSVDDRKGNRYINLLVGLSGSYQKENVITTLKTIELIRQGLDINDDSIYAGFKNVKENTKIEGRWQLVDNSPLTICDTAHNQDGLSSVIEQLANTPHNKLRIVLGFVDDKNIDDLLSLFPRDVTYYFTKASVPRSLDSDRVRKEAEKAGLFGESFPDVESAYIAAKTESGPDDLLFIGGSTFVVADFLEKFHHEPV